MSSATRFLNTSNSSVLQMLTGLFLRFLRMLGFAMHPSEFFLRRTVFLVASILLDFSSFVP